MASLIIEHFFGANTKGDKKDVSEHACIRQKNMVSANGLFSTREGYKKLDSTEYSARINMVYYFKRSVGGNKTLVCAGGNIYAV